MKEAQYAHLPPLDNDNVIGSNQCLCVPKADLNTKKLNQTATLLLFVGVFGVQLDSLEKKYRV